MTAVKGVYKNGKILPEEKLSLPSGTKVWVEVSPLSEKGNAEAVRKALTDAFGILSDSDAERIKKLRKNWKKRIKNHWSV